MMEENMRPLGWCRLDECRRLYDAGLPPDTADMCWGTDDGVRYNNTPWPMPWRKYTAKEHYLPCWSLGALLEWLKRLDNKFEHKIDYRSNRVSYVAADDEVVEDMMTYTDGENLVDACVRMLLWHLDENHIVKSKLFDK